VRKDPVKINNKYYDITLAPVGMSLSLCEKCLEPLILYYRKAHCSDFDVEVIVANWKSLDNWKIHYSGLYLKKIQMYIIVRKFLIWWPSNYIDHYWDSRLYYMSTLNSLTEIPFMTRVKIFSRYLNRWVIKKSSTVYIQVLLQGKWHYMMPLKYEW